MGRDRALVRDLLAYLTANPRAEDREQAVATVFQKAIDHDWFDEYEWNARQAGDAGHTPQDELLLLTTHGILHLLGYDHAEPDEEREMFGLQRKLRIGFAQVVPRHITAPPQ